MLKKFYTIDLLVADTYLIHYNTKDGFCVINVLLRVNDENNTYRFVFNGFKTTDFWHRQ